jgi:hypothetical protein
MITKGGKGDTFSIGLGAMDFLCNILRSADLGFQNN